jgi:hypothetical protein
LFATSEKAEHGGALALWAPSKGETSYASGKTEKHRGLHGTRPGVNPEPKPVGCWARVHSIDRVQFGPSLSSSD